METYQSVKERVLACIQDVKLSKTQSPTTAEDRERMKVISYASAIGSTKYAMLCTRPIVPCHEFGKGVQ